MKQSAWGRALRYYIRQAENYELTTIIGGFCMSLYIWLVGEGTLEIRGLFFLMPTTVFYLAIIMIFSCGISFDQVVTPVMFGCLRKYVFWGSLVMDGLFMAETLVFYLISTSLLEMDRSGFAFKLSLFLMIEGVSKFLGMAAIKWGKMVYTIMCIGIVLISMGVGFVIAYARMGGSLDWIASFLSHSGRGQWLLLGMGIVVCVVSLFGSWHILKKFEVRS